jgi:hypothetical protein
MNRRVLCACVAAALGLLPDVGLAEETTPIAMGPAPYVTMGLALTLAQGSRPSVLGMTPYYQQLALGYRVRGGWVTDATELGTQVGYEMDIFLGYVSKESAPLDPEDEVGFSMLLGVPMRVWSWNAPFSGAVVLHLGAELSAGFANWWSNTARLGIVPGVRVVGRFAWGVGVELDYSVVPFLISGAPHGLSYGRFEHRVLLTGGIGVVGVGVELRLSHDQTRVPESPLVQYSGDQMLSFVAQWRLQED